MRSGVHEAFLTLLGWDGYELESFMPSWLETADFLRLRDEDIEYAMKEWLPQYWDLSLAGVRKCIAACIREAAETAKAARYKAEGKKLLYSNTPAAPACIFANKLAGKGSLVISHPEFIMSTVLGAFFNKKFDSRTEKPCMNPSCHHCGMNSLRADASADGIIPPPAVTWNWGLNCDEAPKTEELIQCLKGNEWHNVLITIPHDAPLGDIESENERRIDYLAKEIRLGQIDVTEYTGVVVEDEHVRAAMNECIAYMERVERLTDLVVRADPQPITGNELTLFGLCLEAAFETGFGYMDDALDTIIAEVEARIALGEGVSQKGAPKMACHFNPLNVPWVDKAFRENNVTLSIGRLFPLARVFKEYLEREDDIYRAVARQCLATPNAVNLSYEAEINAQLLTHYHVDGALYGFFSFDRWIGALQKAMVKIVEERTGVPHFYLEGDYWNSRCNNQEDRLSIIRGICNCLKISRIV